MNQLKSTVRNLVPRAMVPPDAEDTVDLKQIAHILWRWKGTTAIGLLLGLCIGVIYLHFLAPQRFSSTTSLMLDSQQISVTGISGVIADLNRDVATLNSESRVLQSRALLGQVVDKLDLVEDPEFNASLVEKPALQTLASRIRTFLNPLDITLSEDIRKQLATDAVIDRLADDIMVRNSANSLVFDVTATTGDPRKSARIADTLSTIYIDNQIALKTTALQKSAEWLLQRSKSLSSELQEAETELNQLNLKADLISPERLDGMEYQMKQARARAATLREKIEQSQAGGESLTESDNAQQGKTPADSSSGTDSEGLQAQLKGYSDLEKTLEEQITWQRNEQIKLAQLNLNVRELRDLDAYFLKRMGEISSMAGMQSADSRIISKATINLIPTRPMPAVILTLAGLTGLLLSGLLIAWKESAAQTFRTAETLEAITGISVMGQIPVLPAKKRSAVLEYLTRKPTSAGAEAIRNLRTSVLLSDIQHSPQIIGTTSALPGEGKTTIALALAQNFSGMGQKVLLIEGDIRRRIFGEYMAVDTARGLIAVMNGRSRLQEAVTPDGRIGADVLTADISGTNAADLFSSPQFSRLLREARASYDTIIIDTAPVLLVPDSRIIAQNVDAMLFVVAWDSTSQEQVQAGLRMFESIDTAVTGLVLNQIDPKGMKRYGYAGRYGAYASYGSKYYGS